MSQRVVHFSDLTSSNLIVDAYYEGGISGNFSDDPMSKLLPCGTQGGFRPKNNISGGCALAVLYSSLNEPDWPDNLDEEMGLFTYYGDNRSPGRSLHDTPRGGNELLRRSYNAMHEDPLGRERVPPFFVFTKGTKGRDVVFRGLAVPGSNLLKTNEELVAIWKNKAGERFQNYKAVFTILDVSEISREWIQDLLESNPLSSNCPDVWQEWVKNGVYTPLHAPATISHRTKAEQLPSTPNKIEMIERVYEYFKDNPYAFETCAAEIVKMMDSNVVRIDVTRPTRDGGRDGIGLYRIGTTGDNIRVDFAVEAKCFKPGTGVGVRATSRLISRLRHRQFGVLVTTSHLDSQAYKEIREDNHPIIVLAGEDITNILLQAGIGTSNEVQTWLKQYFPLS